MTIGSIGSFPQTPINFKRQNQNVHHTTHNQQSSTKKVIKTAVALTALAAAIATGIYLVKTGKLPIKKALSNKQPYTSQGPVQGNFKSPAEMGKAIVEEFKNMKNRLANHDIIQKEYDEMGLYPVKRIFKSAADMGKAIVAEFKNLENRLANHDVIQKGYEKMNWEQAITKRNSL